ncbi:hypothetical protein B0H12DRAFT_359424 [Mycena haematopus]|nr:hypothetical protein B0H12DRAFT_359424 [Mycena haematopus]
MQLSILFNPAARVYTFRLLLITDIFVIVWDLLVDVNLEGPPVGLAANTPRAFILSSCSVIALHHILVLFKWASLQTSACIDLVLLLTEIGRKFHPYRRPINYLS